MIRRVLSLAVLMGAVLVGCGGTEAAPEVEPTGSATQELVTCTASCQYGSSVACTGTTCSAVNNSHVTCDGAPKYCLEAPPEDPPETCEGLSECAGLNGMSCSPNRSQRHCCIDSTWVSSCTCSQGTWICPL